MARVDEGESMRLVTCAGLVVSLLSACTTQGPKGDPGPQGPAGSPDTGAQILAKLAPVDGAGSGLDADLLGGQAPSTFQSRITGSCPAGGSIRAIDAAGGVTCEPGGALVRTVIVSPVGTIAENGAALLAAHAAIPTTGDRYLLKLEPGTYDLGATRLVLNPLIDLEGSGEGLTRISGPCLGDFADSLVRAVAPVGSVTSEIRFLTIATVSAGNAAVAFSCGGCNVKLSHVTLAANGGVAASGLYADGGGTVSLTDVTATANFADETYGVYLNGASGFIQGSTLSAAGGVSATQGLLLAGGASATVHGSRLLGSDGGVTAFGGTSLKLAGSEVQVGKSGAGSAACVGAFNASYVALSAACL